ncbi:hypothetical protein N0V87_009613 [Didymella glomerata]|uniref:3'-5' exonuclease domain-containing protein n=1 Tax=Didymella glomerata TaxID=749621 RepID=A0A9W8WRT7_9PLEO|nr:hypothetical protein N0V87_009613 [Didymella glomerata]
MKGIRTGIIETEEQLRDLIDYIVARHAPSLLRSPILYIDLEGVNLSREDTAAILTILIDIGMSERRVCLIDLLALGALAFQTAGAMQSTLKDILQDERISKVFFDVRNDSDALFAHFGVALQGIEDVQLMESAWRKTTVSRKFVNGLARCVENEISGDELANWKLAKQRGERLFKAEHGGSTTVFNDRPIAEDIVQYCSGDVQYLPDLRRKYYPQTHEGQNLVRDETKKRVAASMKPEYQPHGPQKVLAPWSQQQNIALDRLHSGDLRYDVDGSQDPHSWSDSPEDEWYDDGPTSCRDVINDCDYEFYYSD